MGLSFGKFLNYLFFTRRCAFCNEVIPFERILCENCEKNLPLITGKLCKKCGCEKKYCKCGKMNEFDAAIAPFYYEKPFNKGLLAFKNNREKWRATDFAAYMADAFKTHFSQEDISFAVCVPDHKARIHDKVKGPRLGYRVSPNVTLASAVCRALNIQLKSDMLYYITETKVRQQALSLHGRKSNVFGSIDIRGDFSQLSGKNILLIDDVLTTGATTSECAKMLKLYGADKVFVLTLFTVKQEKKQKTSRKS